jgi:acyl carrier protein
MVVFICKINVLMEVNDMASVDERVKEIIAEQLGLEKDDIQPEASFIDDLGADSLDIVEMIMTIEDEFDVEISDEDAEKIVSVQDAISYISDKL